MSIPIASKNFFEVINQLLLNSSKITTTLYEILLKLGEITETMEEAVWKMQKYKTLRNYNFRTCRINQVTNNKNMNCRNS